MRDDLSIEEYKIREMVREIVAEERKTSNESYAVKLIEKIVFWVITVCAVGIIGFLGTVTVRAIHFFQ